MAHIAVIGGSNRKASQSHRIAEIAVGMLQAAGATADLISLRDVDIPLWDEAKGAADKPADSPWLTAWAPISARLKAADGVVVVAPEWHGMVPPALKNILFCCDDREVAFKPGYIIGVSGGSGGAYPIAELRMSGFKNNYIHWLPDHLIVRNASKFRPGEPEDEAPPFLKGRMEHGLDILIAFAEAAKPIRETVVDLDRLSNGM